MTKLINLGKKDNVAITSEDTIEIIDLETDTIIKQINY